MKKMGLFSLSPSGGKWKKWLFASKSLLIFSLVFSLQLSASVVSQEKVNLKLVDVSVKELLKEIETQTDLGFLYNLDEIKKLNNISIDANNVTVEEVLESVLKGTNLTYEIDKNVIIIKPKPLTKDKKSLSEQEKQELVEIRGTVLTKSGETLPNATIVEITAEGFRGASSDKNGNFKINVTGPESKLQISYVGYKTQIVEVGNQKFIEVILEASKKDIDEVVVTGIFTRKKESFTGSASTMSGEELKRVGSVNVFQALKNLDPTMSIADNIEMGSNPSTMPDIQIRGTSSLGISDVDANISSNLKGNYLKSANEPLFIVDGFESTVERVYDMDMDRIQSITILKDAAAKAIYGSKAANGVVVIETKKLTSNETRITWKSSLNLEIPDLTSYDLTNASEKLQAEVIDGMYIPSGAGEADKLIELTQLYNSRRELVAKGLDTDWLSKPVQTGIGQKHALTVELGSEYLKVLADLSYNRISGAMKGSFRENIAGTLNMSYRIDKLLFRNIITVNSNSSEDSPYGSFNDYVKMNPYWRAVNLDGTIPRYAEIKSNGQKIPNPLYNSTLDSKIASMYLDVTNNFYLEWNILPDLKATTRIGVSMKRSDGDEFYPSAHTQFDYFDHVIGGDYRKGSYQVNNGKSSGISGDFNLNYSKSIGKHFYFSNVGFNVSERKYQEVVHLVEGFPSDQMDNIFFGRAYALESTPTGIEGITRDIGALGVFSYMYDNRFLSDLTLRTNASSLFGADKRWANFWSLGLGWNIHNEDFMAGGLFKQLKLRGSMGSTGNQNFNTNASIATYSYYLNSFYQGNIGSYIQNLANSMLQWESKFEYNAGFDARIENLTLKFDYYQSNTENLITDITTPLSTGFSSVKENIGKVKNSGFEISSSYLVWSKGRNFLNLNFSIATNKNEITELSDAMRAFNEAADEQAADILQATPVHKYEDGISMNAIWAVPSMGIDPATGHEIYIDREGNKTFEWDANNMVVCGNSSPDYRGNFSINGEYKGIGINVTCRYFGGGQYYNQTLVDRVENVDMEYNVDKRVLTGRWTTPGQITSFKKLGMDYFDVDGDGQSEPYLIPIMTRATSRFVQDYDELSISAINVYYDFDKALLQKMNLGMERLKLALNMNEIARISTVKAERGTSYPFARTLSCSLTATF